MGMAVSELSPRCQGIGICLLGWLREKGARVLEGNSSYAHLLNAIESSGFVCFSFLSPFWWSYRQNPGSHTCYVRTPTQSYMSAKCPRD